MNIDDLYYFKEAAKDLRFARTAERLFISQQNLSNHIKRLEDNYQVLLFERKPHIALTYAGKRMLEYANQLLSQESNIKNEMDDIRREIQGEIVIGASTPRLHIMLPEILPTFFNEFPNVSVRTVDSYAYELEKYVLDYTVDIAFGPFIDNSTELELKPMHMDNLYIVCSDNLLYRTYSSHALDVKAKCIRGCTVADVAELPFIVPTDQNRLSRTFYRCFDAFDLKPNILLKTAFPQFYFLLYSSGVAAGFLTLTSLYEGLSSLKHPINYFPVYTDGKPLSHTVYAIWNKHRYQSSYVRRFLELAEQYFSKIEKMRISFIREDS